MLVVHCWLLRIFEKGMVIGLIKDYNRVIDTYGNKTFKTGLGQYMNTRYEIWEGGALRMHSTDQNLITKRWKYIKENEPPVKKREKMPYIEM